MCAHFFNYSDVNGLREWKRWRMSLLTQLKVLITSERGRVLPTHPAGSQIAVFSSYQGAIGNMQPLGRTV